MKKIMTLVAAIMMIATVSANDNKTDNTATEPMKLAPFTEVNVNVPARIKLIHGDEYGVVANSANSLDTTLLDYQVRNGILYISTESLDMLRASGRGTIITVITPDKDASIKMGNDVQALRKR